MANNLFTGRLNCFFYVRPQNGKLVGNPVGGEVDLRSVFTSTNTKTIYSTDDGIKIFNPDRPNFSSLKRLETGKLYAIETKVDFEVAQIVPNPDTIFQSALVNYLATATATVGGVLQGRLPNLPTIKRNDVETAIINSASGQGYLPEVLADTLGAFRLWASFEPTSSNTFVNNPVASVGSWGSSVDGLSQTNQAFQPYLTSEGLEVSANPPGWLSYDGSFLAGSNFTIFIMERREALNAGYLLGGSSSSNGTNLLAGYASSTNFVFNRLGGNNLSYTVPSTLTNNFRIWALRFNGTNRSIWLNGAKVAEAADSDSLSAYTGAALGWAFEPSYIGKIRHYLVSSTALADDQIPQVNRFLEFYTALYPTDPPELPEGSISLSLPLPNSVYAAQGNENADILVGGTLSVSEGILSAIEASFNGSPYRTLISRPLGATYFALFPQISGNGSLIVRFKDQSTISATVNGISIVNANPTNIVPVVNGSNITATWTAPVGVTVQSYSVGLTQDDGVTWTEINDVLSPSYTFINLVSGEYRIRVKANLATSSSPWIETPNPVTIAGQSPAQLNANLYNDAVSIFRFNDTSWADAKSVNTLTATGTPVSDLDIFGSGAGSVAFDATSYFAAADPTAFRLNATQTWIFNCVNSGSNTSTARLGMLLSKSIASSNPNSRSYNIAVDSSNNGDRIVLQMSNNGTSITGTTSTPYYNAKTPLHVVVVYKANVYTRIYVNGSLAVEGAAPGLNQSTVIPLKIGASLNATNVIANPFTGRAQQMLFLNREVTFEEVTYLWNNGDVREVTAP